MKVLDPQKLEHYRIAAMVGQRLAALRPHTVHVIPEDLAALVDRYTGGLVDEVKIAIAGQCSCHEAGCLHDQIRAAAGDPVQLQERVADLELTLKEVSTQPMPVGAVALARIKAYEARYALSMVRKIIGLAQTLGPENVSVAELLDQLYKAACPGVKHVAEVADVG